MFSTTIRVCIRVQFEQMRLSSRNLKSVFSKPAVDRSGNETREVVCPINVIWVLLDVKIDQSFVSDRKNGSLKSKYSKSVLLSGSRVCI